MAPARRGVAMLVPLLNFREARTPVVEISQ